MCTCGYGLTMAAACACPLCPRGRSMSNSSLYRSEGCSLALWPLCALDTHFCRVRSPHWGELRNRLLVKAALRHESADSEEDREGLGCHLGQGHKMRLASDAQPETILTFYEIITSHFHLSRTSVRGCPTFNCLTCSCFCGCWILVSYNN